MLEIDASQGEGGGQMLRTALSLSAITRTPVRLRNLRAKRDPPGLARQHLCALRAMTEICGAKVQGAELRSTEIIFDPGVIQAGEYHFRVGTAGSTALVFQTVLWPLLVAGQGPSRVVIEGGTHNYQAPSFEFLSHSFLPRIRELGAEVNLELMRHGFYPAGGGQIVATIEPSRCDAKELLVRGAVLEREIKVIRSHLPADIAKRERRAALRELGWPSPTTQILEVDSDGPGNAILVIAHCERGSVVGTGIGRQGVRAQRVGQEASRFVAAELNRSCAVDKYLADQILIPLALAGGGAFSTSVLTQHTKSQARLIEQFLDIQITTQEEPTGEHKIILRSCPKPGASSNGR